MCILVKLLVEYSNYSNKRRIYKCGAYLEGRRLLEGGAYLRPGVY